MKIKDRRPGGAVKTSMRFTPGNSAREPRTKKPIKHPIYPRTPCVLFSCPKKGGIMAKDGTNRGGKRVRAGAKLQKYSNYIQTEWRIRVKSLITHTSKSAFRPLIL